MRTMDLRRAIWDHMLDAEMNKRFYAELVRRAYTRHRCLTAASVVMSSMAAVNFAATILGAGWTLGLAVLAALLMAVTGTWDFRRDALDAERLCRVWTDIGAQWDALWSEHETGEVPDARERFASIDERVRDAIVQGARFDDEKLVDRIMPVVERVRGAAL